MRRPFEFNRRRFLVGTGGAIVALPFLPSLAPRSARAADDSPCFFVAMRQANGVQAATDDAAAWLRTAEATAARTDDAVLLHGIVQARAVVTGNAGRYDEAIAAYRDALASCPFDPQRRPAHRAEIERGLGLALVNAGRSSEALPVLEQARSTLRAAAGEDHPLLSRIDVALGAALSDLDRGAEAQTVLWRGLDRAERTMSPDHPLLADLYERLGRAQHAEGEYADALRSYDLAIERLVATYGENDGRVALAELNRAMCLVHLDRDAEGRVAFEHVLAQFDTIYGRDSEPASVALQNLGWVAMRRGDHRAAIRYHGESQAVLRKVAGPRGRETLAQTRRLVEVLLAAGHHDAARAELAPALAAARETLGPQHEVARGLAELDFALRGPLPKKNMRTP